MNETISVSTEWASLALLLAYLVLLFCAADLGIGAARWLKGHWSDRQDRKSIEHHEAKLRAVKDL